MASELEHLNMALAHLNENASPAVDGASASNAAIKLRRFMEAGRDEVLSRKVWLCGKTYKTLSRSSEDGDWKYSSYFYLPGDCLRVGKVEGCEVMWEAGLRLNEGEERHVIKADATGPLDVSYMRRVGWSGIPPHLFRAVSLMVAARGCLTVNGNSEMSDKLELRAERAIGLAMGLDATQSGGQAVPFPSQLASLRRSAG